MTHRASTPVVCILLFCLFFAGDGFGQSNHALNNNFEPDNPQVVTSVRGHSLAPGIPVFDSQSVIHLPLLKGQLDGEGLSLSPALTLHRGFELPLFKVDFLDVSLVGGGTFQAPIDEDKERTNDSRANATNDSGGKDRIPDDLLDALKELGDFRSHFYMMIYWRVIWVTALVSFVLFLLPGMIIRALDARHEAGLWKQNDSTLAQQGLTQTTDEAKEGQSHE